MPLKTVVIIGVGGKHGAGPIRIPVHRELAPLIAWLLEETQRRGYGLVPGWCWGYAFRRIRGGTGWSRHSWGTAVDLNAPVNGMIKREPGEAKFARRLTDMPEWVPALWKAHGFGWGGDYRSYSDAMHFEFLGSIAQARAIIASLPGRTPAPKPVAVAPVEVVEVPDPVKEPVKEPEKEPEKTEAPKWVILSEGDEGPAVKKLQSKLYVKPVDGKFGPKTKQALVARQKKLGLEPDGIAGPITAKALGLL